MSDKVELKPCPFCGNAATLIRVNYPNGVLRFYRVKCESCKVNGFSRALQEEAIKTWNTRPECPQPEGEWGKEFDEQFPEVLIKKDDAHRTMLGGNSIKSFIRRLLAERRG